MSLSTERRILPCPRCGEMIYSDSAQCRFCSAPLDREAAEAGANVQENVNDACNQAKWIRNIAGAMWVFWLVGLVFGVARLAFLGCFIVVPIFLIVWLIKYSALKTTDTDYRLAKRDLLIAFLIWLPAVALELIGLVLLFV